MISMKYLNLLFFTASKPTEIKEKKKANKEFITRVDQNAAVEDEKISSKPV